MAIILTIPKPKMANYETDKWICLFALLLFSGAAFYGLNKENSDMVAYFSHSSELFSGALLTLLLTKKNGNTPPVDPPKDTTV